MTIFSRLVAVQRRAEKSRRHFNPPLGFRLWKHRWNDHVDGLARQSCVHGGCILRFSGDYEGESALLDTCWPQGGAKSDHKRFWIGRSPRRLPRFFATWLPHFVNATGWFRRFDPTRFWHLLVVNGKQTAHHSINWASWRGDLFLSTNPGMLTVFARWWAAEQVAEALYRGSHPYNIRWSYASRGWYFLLDKWYNFGYQQSQTQLSRLNGRSTRAIFHCRPCTFCRVATFTYVLIQILPRRAEGNYFR